MRDGRQAHESHASPVNEYYFEVLTTTRARRIKFRIFASLARSISPPS